MTFFYRLLYVLFFIVGTTHWLQSQSFKSFETYNDLTKYIDTASDTTYIINYWATWCGPCVKELPYFEEAYSQLQGTKIKLMLVSLDFLKQIDSHLKPFIEKHGYSGEMWLMKDRNFDAWLERVDPSWSGAIPATLVLKGDKRAFKEGEFQSTEDILVFLESFITH